MKAYCFNVGDVVRVDRRGKLEKVKRPSKEHPSIGVIALGLDVDTLEMKKFVLVQGKICLPQHEFNCIQKLMK